MQTTTHSEHVMEVLEKYSNDVDDALYDLYYEIKNCTDKKKRKTLIIDYNRLAEEVNANRKFQSYKLFK